MTDSKINSNDRFIRWQSVLRDHLTFLNNLILTFSVGTVAFILSLLNEDNFNPFCCQKIFLTSGLIMVFCSLTFGLIASLSRLLDFRATVKKIKHEQNDNSDIKKMMDFYGRVTWGLFYFQIAFFCFGILSLTIAFLMIYSDKLF